MNRSKIEWCDHTWNPITGCLHNCEYCYAKTMTKRFSGDVRLNKMAKQDYKTQAARDGSENIYILEKPMINETGSALVYPFEFEPTLHRYRMNNLDKLKNGNNIFVGAMADVFGDWVPDEWIDEVIQQCLNIPRHNYLFLTKNPERYMELYEAGKLPTMENMFYGATVTQGTQLERATKVFTDLPDVYHTFFSIEPIFEDIAANEYWQDAVLQTDWIIVGAQTGRRKDKVVPKMEWIKRIVVSADTAYGVPVFMKDSLIPIVREENMRRDFPKQLQNMTISPKLMKKLYDICYCCNAKLKKSEMIALLARSKRGEQPKQFAFMCKECFKKFCKEIGVDVPELAELVDKVTIGPRKGDDNGERSIHK